MIKAKVIKSFYYAKDKEIYLDEDRFKELEGQGYVALDISNNTNEQIENVNGKKINKVEKTVKVKNDKKRILPK